MKNLFVIALILVLSPALFGKGTRDTRAEEEMAPELGPIAESTEQESAEPTSRFQESPMLAAMVKAGELPPVDERLPENPRVFEMNSEIGKYGGVFQVAWLNQTEWNDFGSGLSVDVRGFFTLTPDGKLEPILAESYEMSDDAQSLILHLRKGTKWSNGQPFTADDILFAVHDVKYNKELSAGIPSYLLAGGEAASVTKVDDYTVQFRFAEPRTVFPIQLTGYYSWQEHLVQPKHYLQKWHINYNPDAEKIAKDEGFTSWSEAFGYHARIYAGQNDLDLPVLSSFLLQEKSTTRMIYERNPYFWTVDKSGQQLPYADGFEATIVGNTEVYELKILNGETDFAAYALSLANYPLYKSRAEEAGLNVLLVQGNEGSIVTLYFNQLFSEDPVIGEVIRDIRFRQAVSLAIDRDAINQALYFGQGSPRQATAISSVSFFEPDWADYYAEHNPAKAVSLLNEMGFTKKDSSGFYLRSDGQPLALIIEFNANLGSDRVTALEMIKENLQKVGIKVMLKGQPLNIVSERMDANLIMVYVNQLQSHERKLYEKPFDNMLQEAIIGDWMDWFSSTGERGVEPPEEAKELYNMVAEWQGTPYGSDEYLQLGKKVLETWTRKLWAVGTVGELPIPLIAKKNVGNVTAPELREIVGAAVAMLSNWRVRYFFKD